MNEKIHQYLLKKYAISDEDFQYGTGDDFQYGGIFSNILYRLNKNKILDKIDKEWLYDKHMYKLIEFIQDLEKRGKSNISLLHKNSNFPHKDYMAPPIQKVKKEIQEDYKKLLEGHMAFIEEDIEDYQIRENKKLKDIKGQSNMRLRKKPKKIHEKTTGYNIRKPHMALHYKQVKIAEHIKTNVIKLKPTNIPEDISSLFLPKIWETINSDIQKDIKELYMAYHHQLWTATSLMAYRILENILKVHIESDLKKGSVNNITSAIKVLEDNKYPSNLLKELSEYKDERNEYMHGNKRAGAGKVKKIVSDIISITMHIHNIKP